MNGTRILSILCVTLSAESRSPSSLTGEMVTFKDTLLDREGLEMCDPKGPGELPKLGRSMRKASPERTVQIQQV